MDLQETSDRLPEHPIPTRQAPAWGAIVIAAGRAACMATDASWARRERSTAHADSGLQEAKRKPLFEPGNPDDPGVDCAIKTAVPNAPYRPTETTYQAFQAGFDHFNRELWGGLLRDCLITLQRRGRRTLGYYSPERFAEIGGTGRTDEIAMNPQHFLHRPMRETLSVLVHEMVHLWQQHHGKPGRRGYHNKEWADNMKDVGLYPSNTGKPGGKEVGQQVIHYIVEGGPFAVASESLASEGFRLAWGELTARIGGDGEEGDEGEDDDNRSNRIKYTCPVCDYVNVWGRPNLNLICGSCKVALQSPPRNR